MHDTSGHVICASSGRFAAGNHDYVIESDETDAAMAKNPLNPNMDTMRVWGVLNA
jgi:hypothetical protein